jgi:hypothetical protein
VTLALSLHAPDDELRDELVPGQHPVEGGRGAGRRPTVLRHDRAPGVHRVRADPRRQRPGVARRPAGPTAQRTGPRLGARQPDPAQPDPRLEVDGLPVRGRARLRPGAARPRASRPRSATRAAGRSTVPAGSWRPPRRDAPLVAAPHPLDEPCTQLWRHPVDAHHDAQAWVSTGRPTSTAWPTQSPSGAGCRVDRLGASGTAGSPTGQLNTCFNALDRHVQAGHGDAARAGLRQPGHRHVRTFTYAELLDEVARFAGALRGLGVGKGDRVVIYMPMVPEAVVAMLACARLGAIHSVVFGGFAAARARRPHRRRQRPKVVVSASCGIEPAGSSSTSRCSTARSSWPRTPGRAASSSSARSARPTLVPDGRDHDWDEAHGRRRARRLRAGGRHRPAVRPLHLGHDRTPKGSCATTAVTPSRCVVA